MCAQVTQPAGGARGPEGTVGAPARCGAEGSPLISGVAGNRGTSKITPNLVAPGAHGAQGTLRGRSCLTPEEKVVLGKESEETRAS